MKRRKNNVWIGKNNLFFKFKMNLKSFKAAFIVGIVVFLVITSAILKYYYHINPLSIFTYYFAKWQVNIGGLPGSLTDLFNKNSYIYFTQLNGTWEKILYKNFNVDALNYFAKIIIPKYKVSAVFGSAGGFFSYILTMQVFDFSGKKVIAEIPIRGRTILKNIKGLDKKYRKNFQMPIAKKIGLPLNECFQHIFIVGASGSGKTTLINQQLHKLKDKKVVILGYKGDFITKFYNPTRDIIFNPLDIRNIGWCLLNDLSKKNQIYSFAKSIIKETKEPFWSDSARTVFTAIAEICLGSGQVSNKIFSNYLKKPLDEMYSLLSRARFHIDSAARACQALGGYNTKLGTSILSTLTEGIMGFEFLNNGSFSFRKWVRSRENNWIFIENGPQQETLNNLFSGVIDIITNEILSLPDVKEIGEREIYIVIDEWGALNKIDSLVKLITLGRSKGACMILANQDLARIKNAYDIEMDSMFNSLGTLVSFKVEDNYTQGYLSKTFGKIEYEKARNSHVMGTEDRNSMSFLRDIHEKYAVLGSELGTLDKFQCFIRFPNGSIVKHKIEKKFFNNILEDDEIFIEKPELKVTENSDLKKLFTKENQDNNEPILVDD
jgi:energy-coupling factor transporter ATP-binding protein EcfA2